MDKQPNKLVNSRDGIWISATRRAAISALVISVCMCLVHVILMYLHPGWSMIGGILIWITMLVSSLLAIVLLRRTQINAALWALAAVLIIIILVYPLLFQNLGLLVALASVIAVVIMFRETISSKQILIILCIGLVFAIFAFVIDNLGSFERPVLFPAWVTNLAGLVLVMILLVIISRQISLYSLRIKLVFSFLLFTVLVIFVVAWFSIQYTQSALVISGNQALSSAALHVMQRIDSFITSNIEMVAAEAQILSIRNYLVTSKFDRTVEMTDQVKQDLFSLAGKRILIEGDLVTYSQGYYLFDRDLNLLISASPSQTMSHYEDVQTLIYEYQGQLPYVSPVLFTSNNQPVILFIAQISDDMGNQTGALAAMYSASVLQKIIQASNNLVGEQSMPLLVDENFLRLGQGLTNGELYKLLSPVEGQELTSLQQAARLPNLPTTELFTQEGNLVAALDAVSLSVTPYFSFVDGSEDGDKVYLAAASRMSSQPWLVIYYQERDLFLAPLLSQIRSIEFLAIVLAVISVLVAIGFAQLLTKPITTLTRVASQVAEGNLAARAVVSTHDEIGKLAGTINLMTEQLQQSLIDIEDRVKQRTFEMERYSRQLQIAIDIGRAVAVIHNLDDLLSSSVVLISERFNFYHVGIFLVDEADEYAVLRASNSDGGKRMISRQHRLVIGHQGIVGFVAATGQSRIALDVGDEPVKFDNPDLPHTRSELALPLISEGVILGVLDIQSTKSSAFTANDMAVMQVLADLVAVAIDNARHFSDSQSAIEAARRANGEISRQAWLKHLEGGNGITVRSQKRSTRLVDQGDKNKRLFGDMPQQISLPIRIHNSVVGYVDTYKPLEQGYWSTDEENALKLLVDQIGIALENARLFETSQMQAERERIKSDFGSKLNESLDVDVVLQTAAKEIRQSLGLQDITIALLDPLAGKPENPDE
jgi:GAF domain-containing protein/HAMP domain-containing protein